MALVLSVDDDPAELRMQTRVVERPGHRVVAAPDGLAGLNAYLAHRPDCVITGFSMPGKDVDRHDRGCVVSHSALRGGHDDCEIALGLASPTPPGVRQATCDQSTSAIARSTLLVWLEATR